MSERLQVLVFDMPKSPAFSEELAFIFHYFESDSTYQGYRKLDIAPGSDE